MKKKQTTILLLIITGILFVMVIYIGFSLRDEKPTPLTTVKKTKASSITYSRTVDVDSGSAPTPTFTPVPTFSVVATPTTQPTTAVNNPTQAVTNIPTNIPIVPVKSLPVTAGQVDYTATFVALASLLIFISFIY